MARKSGFVRREGKMRREMVWLFGQSIAITLASASSVALIRTLNAAALALRPFTIVRTRGMIQVQSDQTAALERYQLMYGHIIVTDVATGVGVASVPTPEADMSSDWHVYESYFGSFGFITGVGVWNNGFSRSFDSKAMRKIDFGDDLAVVGEAGAGSNGLNMVDQFRILVKLH